MSDVPPAGGQAGQEPSEEEVRAYLSQLRQAPAEQVVAEVLQGLLNAAQVKVGRRDGRLLIDVAAQVMDGIREHASEQLTSQVDEVLAQLRTAQVEGEKEVAAAREQGQGEPNDLGEQPEAPGAGAAEQPAGGQAQGQQSGQDAASRLWVPGQ